MANVGPDYRRTVGLFVVLCLFALVYPVGMNAAPRDAVPSDPLDSSRWRYMVAQHFRDAEIVFDERVQVLVPAEAQDLFATPVQIRAPALADVTQIRVIADASAQSRVLDYFPVDAIAAIGFSFEVTQATPLRAAVRTADGVWHIGGAWVDAQGGGCAPPRLSVVDTVGGSSSTVVEARSWLRANGGQRLKVRIVLPEPARALDEITVRDVQGRVHARIVPGRPLAREPVFALDIASRESLQIEARDSKGKRYRTNVAAAGNRAGP